MRCSNRAKYRIIWSEPIEGKLFRVCFEHLKEERKNPDFEGAFEMNTGRIRCYAQKKGEGKQWDRS